MIFRNGVKYLKNRLSSFKSYMGFLYELQVKKSQPRHRTDMNPSSNTKTSLICRFVNIYRFNLDVISNWASSCAWNKIFFSSTQEKRVKSVYYQHETKLYISVRLFLLLTQPNVTIWATYGATMGNLQVSQTLTLSTFCLRERNSLRLEPLRCSVKT